MPACLTRRLWRRSPAKAAGAPQTAKSVAEARGLHGDLTAASGAPANPFDACYVDSDAKIPWHAITRRVSGAPGPAEPVN